MRKEKKVSTVSELKVMLEESSVLVAADYRGLNVEQINNLRNNCRKSGAVLRVVKNTLARKAVPDTSFAEADIFFEGPTALAIGSGDPVNVIKVLSDCSKENEFFKIKGGVLDGTRFSSEEILRMATLPSREALLAKIAGSLNSPLQKMVGSLSNPLTGLMGVLQAIQRSREGN